MHTKRTLQLAQATGPGNTVAIDWVVPGPGTEYRIGIGTGNGIEIGKCRGWRCLLCGQIFSSAITAQPAYFVSQQVVPLVGVIEEYIEPIESRLRRGESSAMWNVYKINAALELGNICCRRRRDGRFAFLFLFMLPCCLIKLNQFNQISRNQH